MFSGVSIHCKWQINIIRENIIEIWREHNPCSAARKKCAAICWMRRASPQIISGALSFLKDNYKGCKADFVYNPANHLLHNLLLAEKTEFEAEQQKMVLKRDVPCQSSHKIQLYSPKYREQYLALHSDDGYWTAEKVIDASDRFRIILALEEDTVVGYMDITHKFEENEPFDLFVKEEYRRRGYGRAILAKAIELNRPKAMMLLVDTDNTAAISLYESLGFDRFVGGNNITAHVSL